MKTTTIGIDLAKSVFQVHGIDAADQVTARKRLRRAEVLTFFEALPPCLVGMEACATAHYWARKIFCSPRNTMTAARKPGPAGASTSPGTFALTTPPSGILDRIQDRAGWGGSRGGRRRFALRSMVMSSNGIRFSPAMLQTAL